MANDPGGLDAKAVTTFKTFSKWVAEAAHELNVHRGLWAPKKLHRTANGAMHMNPLPNGRSAPIEVFNTGDDPVRTYAVAQEELIKLLSGTIEDGLHITNVDVEFVHEVVSGGTAANPKKGPTIVGVIVQGLIGPSSNIDPGDYSSKSSSSGAPLLP